MPALPYLFLSPKSPSVVLSERVVDHFSQNEQNIEIAPGHFYRDLNPLILNLKNTLERSPSATAFTDHFASPSPSTAPSVISSVLSLSPSNPSVKVSRTPYPLTYKVEDYVQLAAYAYFLQHGTLVPQSALPEGVTDEEYLGGVMSFSNNDLPRYVVGRAIERDEKSIGSCKELVNELFEELSEFDFRNGPVRRKFDGVKYAVRKIENVLYELSVTDRSPDSGSSEPSTKKQKTSSSAPPSVVDKASLALIKGRFEAYDQKREDVIKRSREVQKAAKNSIFAMHRGNMKQAKELLDTCVKVGNDIMKVIEEEGAFSNSLEEYAEALLFHTWLTTGKVACMSDFSSLSINEEEYLGGLCDLSGEVGRVAVLKGTKRDREGVQGCLDTNLSVLYALEGLHLPGKLHKKMDPLRGSVRKLENVLYELSLIEAKGGGQVNTDSTTIGGEGE